MASAGLSTVSDAIRIEDEVWDEAFMTRVPGRERHPVTGRERMLPVGARLVQGDAPVDALQPHEPHPLDAITLNGFAHDALASDAFAGDAVALPPPPVRRTVKIQGRGAERHLPWPGETPRRRPTRSLHERAGFQPDRVAMWAVFLGLVLVLVAVLSAHG